MGVELPVVTLGDEKLDMYYGLNSTNSQLDEAYLSFVQVKHMTAELAEIENSVYRLADAIKKTQKRANALDNIMIPQFTATIKYITEALEEKEREDFSRLKVIKRQKEEKRVVKSNSPPDWEGFCICVVLFSIPTHHIIFFPGLFTMPRESIENSSRR